MKENQTSSHNREIGDSPLVSEDQDPLPTASRPDTPVVESSITWSQLKGDDDGPKGNGLADLVAAGEQEEKLFHLPPDTSEFSEILESMMDGEFRSTAAVLQTFMHQELAMHVTGLAAREGVSPRLSVLSMASVVGTLLMPTVKVEHRGRALPVGLQVVASAPSMDGKTTCFDEFAQPLRKVLDRAYASAPGKSTAARWLGHVTSSKFCDAMDQNPTGSVAIMDSDGRKDIQSIIRGTLSPFLNPMLVRGARGEGFTWSKFKKEIDIPSLKVSMLLMCQWDKTIELSRNKEASEGGLLGRLILVNGNSLGATDPTWSGSTDNKHWIRCLETIAQFTQECSDNGVDLSLKFEKAALKRLDEIRASRIDSPFPVRSAEITLKLASILYVLWEVGESICQERPISLDGEIAECWVKAAHDLFVECHETHLAEIQRQVDEPRQANEKSIVAKMHSHLGTYGVILQKDARSLGFRWDDLIYYTEKYPDVFRKDTFAKTKVGRPPNGIALQKPAPDAGGGGVKEGGDPAA
jgi:hypothetical protein